MKISKFQIIVLSVFVVFIIAGVAAFATFKGTSDADTMPAITVWGTFPKTSFDEYLTKMNNNLPVQLRITYTEYSEESFSAAFISALARGTGPDAMLIPSDILLPNADKLAPIPYSVLSQRTFLNTFVDQARVYLGPNGILGVPFTIDPMVMYWNRDIYNASGVATPPRYWDEFTALVPKLTVREVDGPVTRSAIALGDFTNVDYARELLATLMFQKGVQITEQFADGSVASTLRAPNIDSLTGVIQYFTQFVDPRSDSYSWNRSWPNSRTAFLSGKLSTYFGLASDLYKLRNRNPNLNFDVTALPQQRSGGVAASYARMYGLSIVRASANTNATYQIISTMVAPQFLVNISNDLYLPSVSRAVIASGSTDPYIEIFNRAALISRSWLDAEPAESNRIFAEMIQSVTSGKKSPAQALNDAGSTYDIVLRQVTTR